MVNERGQLLLIGAILIGVTIVGTVVLLNGMQYADSAGAQSQRQVLDDAELTEEMVERDVERLAIRIFEHDPDDPEKSFRKNISAYNNHTRNMSLSRGGATVNVTFNESVIEGYKVNQSDSTNSFQCQQPAQCSPPRKNWDLATDAYVVPRFTLTTDTLSGNFHNAFSINVTNDTGHAWEANLTSSSGGQLVVRERSGSTVSCTSTGDEVIELDLIEGVARDTDSDCRFESFTDVMEPPYTIRFLNGNKGTGTYQLFVEGSVDENKFESHNARSYPVVPAIDYQYRSPYLEYNRTILVETTEGSR